VLPRVKTHVPNATAPPQQTRITARLTNRTRFITRSKVPPITAGVDPETGYLGENSGPPLTGLAPGVKIPEFAWQSTS
jgi:hypothetical protein